jgi:hypothetical protein
LHSAAYTGLNFVLSVIKDINNQLWYERNTGQLVSAVQRRVQHPVILFLAEGGQRRAPFGARWEQSVTQLRPALIGFVSQNGQRSVARQIAL